MKTIQDKARHAAKEVMSIRGVNVAQSSFYIVWMSKTLRNWKAVLGTLVLEDMLFEVTYDGDKKLAYVDVYQKLENHVVDDESL